MERVGSHLVRSAAVAALGSFLFGFDTAVVSGTTEALRLRFSLGSAFLGFTVASALLGTILGAITAGRPSERHGRVPVLRLHYKMFRRTDCALTSLRQASISTSLLPAPQRARSLNRWSRLISRLHVPVS